MDTNLEYVPHPPIWDKPETGPSGWTRQKYFFSGTEISLFIAPGKGKVPMFSARTCLSEHLTEFLFGLPKHIAQRIAFHTDFMSARRAPWTKLPNQYWYAVQGSEVFVETKPFGYLIPCLRFFPFGSYSLIATDLTDEMAVELVAYILSAQ